MNDFTTTEPHTEPEADGTHPETGNLLTSSAAMARPVEQTPDGLPMGVVVDPATDAFFEPAVRGQPIAPKSLQTPSNLHVCIVTPFPIKEGQVGGGVEAASLRLAHALGADGQTRVSIVAPAPVTRFEQRGTIDIHWTACKLSFLPGILTYWTTERKALQAAARNVHADVVHFQAIAGWGLGYRGPRVFQMHGVPEDAVMLTQRKTRYLSRLVHLMVGSPEYQFV